MKIAIKSQEDGWVLDEISKDFCKHTRHQVGEFGSNPDLFWSINTFAFPAMIGRFSRSCKSVLQIHHVNTEMLSEYNFKSFNEADFCIVPNKITEKVVLRYLKIPVTRLPYWLLSSRMIPKDKDKVLKIKREICSDGEVLIGSFVKDGNGKSGGTPKLAKNPDLFLDILRKLKPNINIKVLLAGYARNYIRSKLEEMRIPYVYLNKYDDINLLYDCLDWYLVPSKYEGGPQSVLEASYRKIKILSTNVGLAPEILHPDCVCESADEFVEKILRGHGCLDHNYSVVKQNYTPDIVIKKYDDYFESCVRS